MAASRPAAPAPTTMMSQLSSDTSALSPGCGVAQLHLFPARHIFQGPGQELSLGSAAKLAVRGLGGGMGSLTAIAARVCSRKPSRNSRNRQQVIIAATLK